MKKLLEYNFPEDLKEMTEKELSLLSYEIRDFLIEKVSKTGGHIASNLGVVELTIALHKVFDSPKDKIIFDVGHQSYIHKILTGRADQFDSLRCFQGISGFPKRSESPHDQYDAGHASTSISIGLGFAAARDLMGDNFEVVCVTGDGAMTGGIAFEALNNAGSMGSKLIVILNDNEMSIDRNSGSLSHHLSKLRASKTYLDFKKQLKRTVKGIPRVGDNLYAGMDHLRNSLKYAIVQGAIFEELGFTYFGPTDGHNIHDLNEVLSLAKAIDGPCLVHIVTKKGKGYRNAEQNPCKYHGVAPFDPTSGNAIKTMNGKTYSQIFGDKIINLASKDQKIVAVSAAMIDGTGLCELKKVFPERIFDAGIAEQHAVAFAAGMALNGYRPFVAIYSTFLQRAYDQLITDICLQNLPVIFMIDRAGAVGSDGETHHGVFDLSYLSHMPGMTVMAPMDGRELTAMMEYALTLSGPSAIRYPRGQAPDHTDLIKNYEINKKSLRVIKGKDVSIVAIGKMTDIAVKACEILNTYGYEAEIINSRFLKPLDIGTILSSVRKTKRLVTLEDNVLVGGFGSGILSMLNEYDQENLKTLRLGWPDQFIPHGSVDELFSLHGLDPNSVAERVRDFIERTT